MPLLNATNIPERLTSFTAECLVILDNCVVSKYGLVYNREIVRTKARPVSFVVGCSPWPMKPDGLFLSLRDNGQGRIDNGQLSIVGRGAACCASNQTVSRPHTEHRVLTRCGLDERDYAHIQPPNSECCLPEAQYAAPLPSQGQFL